jgi:hypothetical protein
MRAPLNVLERALLLGASLLLIRPDAAGQWIGALAAAALYARNRVRARAA